jgi:hypothetical protein
MDYTDLTAAELKALCAKRDIKPSRAKADMIEDLKARDAADELTRLGQEIDYDANLTKWETELLESAGASETPVEEVEAPEVHLAPETAAEADEEPGWVQEGRLYKRYKRHGILDDREHRNNLTDVVEEAVIRGLDYFGPSFRIDDGDSASWLYAINVR